MKIPNPLYYPWAVLLGVVVLAGGIRGLRSPQWLIIPLAAIVTTATATLQRSQEPETWDLDHPELEAELRAAKQQAEQLATKTTILMADANQYLTSVEHIDLLVMIQGACHQLRSLPQRIDQTALSFKNMDDLFTVDELQQQLAEVKQRLHVRSSRPYPHLQAMETSLERTIQLVQQGQDTRQAQVAHISTSILDTGSVLQDLQNTLRSGNLEDPATLDQLQQLSQDLKTLPQTIEHFISRQGYLIHE